MRPPGSDPSDSWRQTRRGTSDTCTTTRGTRRAPTSRTARSIGATCRTPLAPAGAILLLGHGNGKANASHRWVAYAEQHHKDVAAKVVADIRVDIDHLTVQQVLGLAQYYFDAPSG